MCDMYNPWAENRQGTLCGECQPGMGEVLFSPKCLPDKECDDSWFLSLNFIAAVLGIVLLMYQEQFFALGNKLFGKNQPDSLEESNGSTVLNYKAKCKVYTETTT